MNLLSHIIIGFGAKAFGRQTYVYVGDYSRQSEESLIRYYTSLVKAGATHILNGFMVPNCPCGTPDLADSVGDWARMSASGRRIVLDHVHANGGMFHLVTGGGTYNQQYLEYTPKAFTDYVCGHAAFYGYDGVHFDLEALPEGFGKTSKSIKWAIMATKLCRNYVGHISHSPLSSYLGKWGGFGYEELLPHVDKLLVQYYNVHLGAVHDGYDNIFISDSHQAAISQIWGRNPFDREKLVVGKYIYPTYGGSGMMTSTDLAAALNRAESELGYTAGVMIWKYPDSWDTHNLLDFLSTDLPRLSRHTDPITPLAATVPVSNTSLHH